MRECEAISALAEWEMHAKVLEDERMVASEELDAERAARAVVEAREVSCTTLNPLLSLAMSNWFL